jgi:tetratricopeptide (TPR) repeat protein
VTYQLRKFVRRHRILVGSAALVLVIAVAAAVDSLTYLAKARRSERVALDREATAKRERDRAKALAERILERSIASTFEFAPRLKDLAGGVPLSTEVIANAIEDLEALLAEARDDPVIRSRIAYAHLRLGDVRGNPTYPNLGDRAGANESYARAAEIAAALATKRPDDPEVRCLVAICDRNRGAMAVYARDHDRARRHLQAALATFESLCRDHPDELRYRAELGNTHDKLVGLSSRTGDAAALRRHATEYARVFTELKDLRPENEGYRAQVAFARQQLAGAHWKEGRFETAREEWNLAGKLLGGLAAEHPEKTVYRVKLAWSELWAGAAAERLGRLEAAEERFTRAIEAYAALVAEAPRNAQFPPLLANAWYMHGGLAETRADRAGAPDAEQRGHLETAVARFRESLAVYERLREEGRLVKMYASFPEAIRRRIEGIESRLAKLPPR